MMQATRLRWIGGTRMRALRDAVASHCAAWRSQWAVAGEAFGVEVETIDGDRAEKHPFDPRWHAMSTHNGTCYVHASSATFEGLGKALAGMTTADGRGIALGIGRRGLTDLAARLHATSAGEALVALPGMPDPHAIGRKYGAAGCLLRLGPITIELYMDASLCDALIPPEQVGTGALQTRRAAIQSVEATFDAMLDLGSASILESLAFRAGEIIRTTISIGAPVHLRTASGSEALAGVLVAANGRRAMRIADPIKQQARKS